MIVLLTAKTPKRGYYLAFLADPIPNPYGLGMSGGSSNPEGGTELNGQAFSNARQIFYFLAKRQNIQAPSETKITFGSQISNSG